VLVRHAARARGTRGGARACGTQIDLLRFQVDEIVAAELTDPDETRRSKPKKTCCRATARRRWRRPIPRSKGPHRRHRCSQAELDGRAPFAALMPPPRRAGRGGRHRARVALASDAITDDPARLDVVRAQRNLVRELGHASTATPRRGHGVRAATPRLVSTSWKVSRRAAELETTAREARRDRDAAAGRSAAERCRRAVGPGDRGASAELAMPHAAMEVEIEPAEPTDDGA
jgi:hypothetical protein